MFKHHNNKLIKFIYGNGLQNFLCRPFQPILGLTLFPMEPRSEIQKFYHRLNTVKRMVLNREFL